MLLYSSLFKWTQSTPSCTNTYVHVGAISFGANLEQTTCELAQWTKLSLCTVIVGELNLFKSSRLVTFISLQDLFGHILIMISGFIT